MIVLIVIIGIALLIVGIMNLLSLKKLRRFSSKKKSQLNDAKYYELKYKTDFLIALFTIIVTVAGFLGYETIESAKKEIKNEFFVETSTIDSLLLITKRKVLAQDSILAKIELKQEIINKLIPKNERILTDQNYRIKKLQEVIDKLNNTNKQKRNFYLISNLKTDPDGKDKTFRFSDIMTTQGDRLPIFSSPPSIIAIPTSSIDLDIYDIGINDFKVGVAGWTEWDKEIEPPFIFSLMIIENK